MICELRHHLIGIYEVTMNLTDFIQMVSHLQNSSKDLSTLIVMVVYIRKAMLLDVSLLLRRTADEREGVLHC